MKSAIILAKITFQELIREKFFIVAVFASMLLLAVSLLLGSLTFAEQQRIIVDFGFAAIELSSLGIVLFSGAFIITKEIEKQTCLLLLSKPLSRGQFLVGKWLGLVLLITMTIILLSSVLFLLVRQFNFLGNFLIISFSIWLKTIVILSLVFLVSGVVRPVFSLLFGMTIYLLGHWLHDLEFFANKTKDEFIINSFRVLHELTPQFYRFNWKSYYFLEKGIGSGQLYPMFFYLSLWAFVLLILAVLVFRRKDIV